MQQVDLARADFAAIESHLDILHQQLARLPTRTYFCQTLLLATASVWGLIAVLILMR